MKTKLLIKWLLLQRKAKLFRRKVMAFFGRPHQVTLVYGIFNDYSTVVFPPIVYWTKTVPDLPEIGSENPNGPGYLLEWKIDSLGK